MIPAASSRSTSPPVGFWLEAASAKIFGFNSVSILLPQALAGVLSVWLLYYLVRRHFGVIAGSLAALALALNPISILTNRNVTIDSTLTLVLLLGAWTMLKAAETGRLRWLLLTTFIIGIGFNIKMLEAYLATYHALRLRAWKMGEEAILSPQNFTLQGPAMANVRTSARRAERDAVRISWYEGVPPSEVMQQLEQVSSAWLEYKSSSHAAETWFSTGRLDEVIESNVTLWGNASKLLAVACGAVLSYAFMRFWTFAGRSQDRPKQQETL